MYFQTSTYLATHVMYTCYIAAMYITSDICICAFSVGMQLIIVNVHHAGGIRPVPGWLMTIAKCRTDKSTGAGVVHDDVKCNEDVNGEEGPSNNSQAPNDGKHTSDAKRENRAGVPSDVVSEFIKNDWRFIARRCDALCFSLFLVFHVMFTVAVIFALLKK